MDQATTSTASANILHCALEFEQVVLAVGDPVSGSRAAQSLPTGRLQAKLSRAGGAARSRLHDRASEADAQAESARSDLRPRTGQFCSLPGSGDRGSCVFCRRSLTTCSM
jgi:hypothetical protein